MKALIFFGIILLMLGIVGCQTEKIIDVTPDEPVITQYNVNFTNSPEVVNLLVNRTIDVPIEVVVHKKDGGIGTGARVDFYESTSFGTFVTGVDTADDDGKASTIFRTTPNRYGTCKIFVLVPGGRTDAEFQVRPITAPASIEIIGNGQVKVRPGQNAVIQFSLMATDSNHVEVPDVPIIARLRGDAGGRTFGAISSDLRFTSLGLFGREWLIVTTNIPEVETQLSDSVMITVERLDIDIGSITARAVPNLLILQPDSFGYAEIRVQVRDAHNVGIEGIIIDAVTDLGTILATDTTDSNGVAVFPISFFNEYGIAHIIFSIRGTDWEATTQISVYYDEEVTITVDWSHSDPYSTHFRTRPDSLVTFRLRAIVKDNQGQSLAGEVFDLVTDMGVFEVSPAVTNQLGIANIVWNNNFEEGTAQLVYHLRGTEIYRMDELRVEFEPTVGRIDLTIEPDTIFAGSNEPIHLVMLATDGHGNPVANQQVQINADLGTIVDITLTDSTGRAEGSMMFNNISSGVVGIRAYIGDVSDTALLWILPDNSPRSIELRTDRSDVEIEGEMILTATVRTTGGEPINRPTTVVYKLLNVDPFTGPHFPNGRSLDSSQTDDSGFATIVMSAGTQVGGVLMKCYTWRDPETRQDTVWSALISTVQVVAGPPATIDLDVNDDGEDAGGGMWRVPVTTRVYDRRFNPISNVDVNFRVEPDSVASIQPGRQGQAWIVYHSLNTFDPFTLTAVVQGENVPIIVQLQHVLPLQDGVLELTVDPQNWMFNRDRPNDTCEVEVKAFLVDGHNIAINNAPILFRTDRLGFYWFDFMTNRYAPFAPAPARKYTGVVDQRNNEAPGFATVFLRGIMSSYFLDEFTLEVTVHIDASVEGYDVVADPGFVFMTRH